MKLSRLGSSFPWRMAVLLALVSCLPLLIFGAWFRWGLQPLQRYYFAAYWDSAKSATQPGAETQIQWLYKTAPGRKRQLVIGLDVRDGGARNLPIELSPSAIEAGWTGVEKGPVQKANAAELDGLL